MRNQKGCDTSEEDATSPHQPEEGWISEDSRDRGVRRQTGGKTYKIEGNNGGKVEKRTALKTLQRNGGEMRRLEVKR